MPSIARRTLSSFVMSSALALTATAQAQTTTFEVSADVTDSCDVSATNLVFGQISPVDDTEFLGTSTITVTCSNGTAYNIGLDEGLHGESVTARQMQIGGDTDTLDYGLFQDSERLTNWGATVGTDTVADTGDGAGQAHTVFGRVPPGQQTAATGAYADTITVTVSF